MFRRSVHAASSFVTGVALPQFVGQVRLTSKPGFLGSYSVWNPPVSLFCRSVLRIWTSTLGWTNPAFFIRAGGKAWPGPLFLDSLVTPYA